MNSACMTTGITSHSNPHHHRVLWVLGVASTFVCTLSCSSCEHVVMLVLRAVKERGT
jgi:hypothetical protein